MGKKKNAEHDTRALLIGYSILYRGKPDLCVGPLNQRELERTGTTVVVSYARVPVGTEVWLANGYDMKGGKYKPGSSNPYIREKPASWQCRAKVMNVKRVPGHTPEQPMYEMTMARLSAVEKRNLRH